MPTEPNALNPVTENKTAATSSGAHRLFLIDSMSYIFRAYHALPRLINRKGLSTHAVYGFNSMLRKLLSTYEPEYVGAVFDLAGPTFRHESFAAYKANREEMPGDLSEQIPYIRRLLDAMKIPVLAHPGFEADDVIGTLARQAAEHGLEVFIISSDKDMLQLVGDHIRVLNPMKEDLVCDPPKVLELTGIEPSQIPDLMALQGDSIDNIPGAPGIGPKGARELIQKYGRVENALEHASEVTGKRYREALANYRDQILLSKQLATIDTNAPVQFSPDEVRRQPQDLDELRKIYQELDFTSLLKDLLPAADASERRYVTLPEPATAETESAAEHRLHDLLTSIPPDQVVGMAVPLDGMKVPILSGLEAALSPTPGTAWVISSPLLPQLKSWLEDPNIPKAVHDAKCSMMALQTAGIQLQGVRHDTMLYSYLLNATESNHTLASAVERQFATKPSGELAEQADWVGQLAPMFEHEIESQGLMRLYSEIELPLVSILAEMECCGVKLDPAPLRQLSTRLEADLDKLCRQIYELTGSEFNINSPKQLGEVLFDKMGLTTARPRSKAKAASTAIDVLEELALTHEAPRRVLEYRQLAKLKSTYVDALPRMIHPVTGRLHTHYNQAGAATGRLSSSNPNLQNIPIRTELGREIRAAFVAEKGYVLLAADYSQIELRLLAHLTQDPLLLEAFRRGDDIHELTASAVFGVPPAQQTSEHRRRAKAINYGIVYGLSAFGLSQQLGIPQAEAQDFINHYFERYQGVRKYIDAALEQVRKTGEVRTFCGRLRRIPEINSKNWNLRQFAERTAINTPLQGGAADLIKLAMLGLHRGLRAANLHARLILQVHDELILEVPEQELAATAALVRERMEQTYSFSVPIVAEVAAGPNWRDMEDIRADAHT